MILQIEKLKQLFSIQDYICTIVANGTTATITLTNHNFKTGDYLNITGTSTVMDGMQLVNRLNNNSLEFLTTYNGTKTAVIKNYDDQLTNIIAVTESFIKQYCDLEYGNTAEASEIYDSKINGIVLLKRGNVIESDIKSIKLSRENNFTDSSKYITLTSDDYFVYDNHIELKFEKCYEYLNCRKAVKITYTTQAVPDGLKRVAYQIAEFNFRVDNDKSIHYESQTLNGDQKVYAQSLPQKVLENLDAYKRIGIGDPY